ncbi:MAG TPA: hypothetical protein DCF45_11955 [Gammaproteobacteria bacterium]|nr:hypothetical protein [Gammaproteobacteria bacterium]
MISRAAGLALGTLLVWGSGLVSAADIYKWVDENGQTHFGARPPTEVESEWVKPPPKPALPMDFGIELRKQFEQKQADYTVQRQQEKENKAQLEAEKVEREKNCAQSRKAVADIKSYMNKRMFDSQGNYVEEAERLKKLAKAEESASFWCD